MPEAMLMDHGTPWWNAKAPTGATWLTVWLMRQGIELHWSGYRHPQTQGKVERFHGSLQRAQKQRGVPDQQGNSGWTSIAMSTTMCDPTKLWACTLPPVGGARVFEAMIPTPRHGSTEKEPRW